MNLNCVANQFLNLRNFATHDHWITANQHLKDESVINLSQATSNRTVYISGSWIFSFDVQHRLHNCLSELPLSRHVLWDISWEHPFLLTLSMFCQSIRSMVVRNVILVTQWQNKAVSILWRNTILVSLLFRWTFVFCFQTSPELPIQDTTVMLLTDGRMVC
jgi:hypothetical protein